VIPFAAGQSARFVLTVRSESATRLWSDEMVGRVRPVAEVLVSTWERECLKRELRQNAAMLRSLNLELSRSEDRQRRRLATVLHDDLAQNLFAASVQLVALRDRPANGGTVPLLDRSISLVNQALQQARDLTVELCPPTLYETGLIRALIELADRFSRRYEIACRVVSACEDTRFGSDIEILLYQAVRELLTNVRRHARARHVEIRLEMLDDKPALSVIDDGVGFPASPAGGGHSKSGFGLFNIRERINSLGGRVEVKPGTDGGCCVRLVLPATAAVPNRKG